MVLAYKTVAKKITLSNYQITIIKKDTIIQFSFTKYKLKDIKIYIFE